MDERQEEMNNQEFETFKRMLVLHLEELKGLGGRCGSLEAKARHHHRDAEGLNEQGRGEIPGPANKQAHSTTGSPARAGLFLCLETR